jgi:hypothetical protein
LARQHQDSTATVRLGELENTIDVLQLGQAAAEVELGPLGMPHYGPLRRPGGSLGRGVWSFTATSIYVTIVPQTDANSQPHQLVEKASSTSRRQYRHGRQPRPDRQRRRGSTSGVI